MSPQNPLGVLQVNIVMAKSNTPKFRKNLILHNAPVVPSKCVPAMIFKLNLEWHHLHNVFSPIWTLLL